MCWCTCVHGSCTLEEQQVTLKHSVAKEKDGNVEISKIKRGIVRQLHLWEGHEMSAEFRESDLSRVPTRRGSRNCR